MKSMKKNDIMKMDNYMRKLHVGLDIHEGSITGTAMRKDGTVNVVIEFSTVHYL